MYQKNQTYIKYFIILLFYISYGTGFFFRENIAGGAEQDFENYTWPLIKAFKYNFYDTLLNYGNFGEGSLPLFHIINAYLNPFSNNKFLFQASVALISILNAYFFSIIIKDKYQLKKIDSYLYSSIFLILPFFRSSAFWGLTENFGWLFLLLSIKYFNDYFKKKNRNETTCVFFICFFSSLALYIRPYLIFFPAFIVLKSIFFRDYILFKKIFFFYFFMSIPGFFLLYIWGGSITIGPDKIDLFDNYHNPKFIFKNLIIFFSIFFFYMLPFEISKILTKFNYPKKKQTFLFLIILILIFILYSLHIFDYLKEIKIGGGALLKLNQIIFKEFYFFLFISSVGLFQILNYIYISKENLFLFMTLLIFCFPKIILQEYFEPLIIILGFTLLNFSHNITKMFKSNKTILVFLTYFILYFTSSFFYRYFF